MQFSLINVLICTYILCINAFIYIVDGIVFENAKWEFIVKIIMQGITTHTHTQYTHTYKHAHTNTDTQTLTHLVATIEPSIWKAILYTGLEWPSYREKHHTKHKHKHTP